MASENNSLPHSSHAPESLNPSPIKDDAPDTGSTPSPTQDESGSPASLLTQGADLSTADITDIMAVQPFSVTVGSPLEEGAAKADKEALIGAIKAVQDPELMMNIYELGLIYNIDQAENGDVSILMTLTSPTCPIAGDMPSMVANAVSSVPGTGRVTVELTFDPPWTMDRLSDELKLLMDVL